MPENARKSDIIAVCGLIILGLIGYIVYLQWYAQPAQVLQTSASDTREVYVEQARGTDANAHVDSVIIDDYKDSTYKVVAFAVNPFGEHAQYEHLYVVVPRGINDYACGGRYDAGACFFFLEGTDYGGAIAHYVTTWMGSFAGLTPGTLKFVDVDTVIFDAANGDAGYSVYERWSLNVRTGKALMLSREESSAEDL